MRVPDTEVYVVDVSFAMLGEAALRDYLNELPTSFALPDEAVDKLRTAARRILQASPDFQRFLKDTGASIVPGDRQGWAPAGASHVH
jgi:NTE family protein